MPSIRHKVAVWRRSRKVLIQESISSFPILFNSHKHIRRLLSHNSGNVAFIFGLAAIPVIALVGAGIDDSITPYLLVFWSRSVGVFGDSS